MKSTALLVSAAALLLSACATSTEPAEQHTAMKCDTTEAPTGSRIARRENCVRSPEAARKQ